MEAISYRQKPKEINDIQWDKMETVFQNIPRQVKHYWVQGVK